MYTALIALVLVHSTSSANDHYCPPSSCGIISNISFPFRLKSKPKICGESRYELSCENNRKVLHLFAGKYYVRKINYHNYTIRVADSGKHNDNYFSTTPSYSLYRYNFSNWYYSTYTTYGNAELSRNVVFMDTSTCIHNSSKYMSPSMRYRYVKVGTTSATEVADSCWVEKITRTSWPRMNWYTVFRFHGSKVIVKVFAEESYATLMTRTTFNAGSVVGK